MRVRNRAQIITVIVIILGLVGIIEGCNVKKENLRKSIINERELSAKSIEENLPIIIVNQFDYISDASVVVDLDAYEHNYTDYEGKPACYIQWENNIKLSCIADESFNKKSDSLKLEMFKQITDRAKNEAGNIQKNVAPIYDDYYSRSEIVDVFEEGVFCRRNIQTLLRAGSNEYSYNGYSWHISEAFTCNGKETDLTPMPSSSTTETSTKSTDKSKSSAGKKKSTAKPYYGDYYPDCDDYEDWEEFMDDWDGEMPDESDASDYWDDW